MRICLLFLLLSPLVLGGCQTGSRVSADVILRLPSTTNRTNNLEEDSQLREAVEIVDSALKRNGFKLDNDQPPHAKQFWKFRTYTSARLVAQVTVRFDQNSKIVTVFVLRPRPHFYPPPETQQVRNEIAQELANRFGLEWVTMQNSGDFSTEEIKRTVPP